MTVTLADLGAARVITWDRQERRNAWDLPTMTAIAAEIEVAGRDTAVRMIATRVEHADRVHARIGAELDRHEAAARLAHDGDFVERDLAVQRRAGALVLRFGPIDRGAQVVGRARAAAAPGSAAVPSRRSHATRSSSEIPRSECC